MVSGEMFATEAVVTVLCTALVFVAEYMSQFGKVNLLARRLAWLYGKRKLEEIDTLTGPIWHSMMACRKSHFRCMFFDPVGF